MTFGEKLKRMRLEKNLSQSELGAMIGISERTIYSYEQLGKIPRSGNLKKIADALGTTPEYLSDESMEPTTDPDRVDEEDFLKRVRKAYGESSYIEAKTLLNSASTMFAGGSIDESAQDIFRQSLMRMYLKSKEEASNAEIRKKRVSRKRNEPNDQSQ